MNPYRIRLNAAKMHALRLRPPASVMIEEHCKEAESWGVRLDRPAFDGPPDATITEVDRVRDSITITRR